MVLCRFCAHADRQHRGSLVPPQIAIKRNFAFVEMPDVRTSQDALESLNHKWLGGRQITLEYKAKGGGGGAAGYALWLYPWPDTPPRQPP